MTDLISLLREHALRYPILTPQDAVKLLYQRAFGCGHFVSDPTISLARLKKESTYALPSSAPCEVLGNGWGRLHLGNFTDTELPLEILNRMFVLSSQHPVDDFSHFQSSLSILKTECAQGTFSFSPQDLDKYLSAYAAEGYPAVSHSEIYRKSYHPSYRVIRTDYFLLLPIIQHLSALLEKKEHVVIAIDGPAASGKTTLSYLLANLYNAPVIHMDDFFLPPSLRSPERLNEPGGNLHRERFLKEVVPSLSQNSAFSYGQYDCSIREIRGKQQIPSAALHIVEGSYSHHPAWQDIYDLRIFLQVDSAVQEHRIRHRNGDEMWQRFHDQWIPMEQKYFEAFNIPAKSHIFLKI